MNVKLLKQVQKDIKNSLTFDQRTYVHDCGTPACIAGHIIARHYRASEAILQHCAAFSLKTHARTAAGLDNHQADELFMGFPYSARQTTKDEAIAAIQSLIDTGEVEWK